MEIKTVIVLTIDSLKYDRLGVAGYPLSLTPTIDALAQSGIHCKQAISHSSCTQMSHPSIWTSSLPLDFGGYDYGIKERPVALAEIFQQNGFKTAAFSTSPFLDSYSGYHRGFDEFHSLYGIRGIWYIVYQNYLRHYFSQWQNGAKSDDELYTIIAPMLQETLSFVIQICQKNIDYLSCGHYIRNELIHDYDFDKIIRRCRDFINCLQENPKRFVSDNIQRISTNELCTLLGLNIPTLNFYQRVALKGLSKSRFGAIQLMETNFQNLKGISPSTFVTGSYILQTVTSWLERYRSEKNFLWICLDDLHEMYCSPNAIQIPFPSPKLLLERAKLGNQYQGGLSYDISLNYVDRLIDKLMKKLKSSGCLDQTLIAICSDHGRHWFLDDPHTKKRRKNVLDFYEEDLRIPLIFWNPHMEQREIDHLCGLIDLAPTLVDLAGFTQIPAFKGYPVYSKQAEARKYLIAEDTDTGPCDLKNDALRIAIRSSNYKYIWQEAKAGKAERNEFYDLEKDPHEKENLASKLGYEAATQELKSIIQQRRNTLKSEYKHSVSV